MIRNADFNLYVSAISTLPMLIMLLNDAVFYSLLSFATSASFLLVFSSIGLYIYLWGRDYFSRIRNPTSQLLTKALIVNLPLLLIIIQILTTRNLSSFIPGFFAYLFFGVVACIHQIIAGRRVGATHRISFFILGYILALMLYTGSYLGQQTGQIFSLLSIFDHLAGVASIVIFIRSPPPLPLASLVRITMIFAIPAITYTSLTSQVRQTEVKDSPSAPPRLANSLGPAVALLTATGVLLVIPLSLIARNLLDSVPYLATIIPSFAVGILLLMLVAVLDRP